MSYATLAQMRAMLTQIPAGTTVDAFLQELLDRATGLIDLELGFSLAAFGAAGTAKDVRTSRSIGDTFTLPVHEAGTVTAVLIVYGKGSTGETAEAVTDWVELDDGRLYHSGGWAQDTFYRVTCKWGYGPASDAIEQLCLEVARDLWFAKDASMSSNTVGVEGGGSVTVQYAWTHRQYKVLQATRDAAGQWGIA